MPYDLPGKVDVLVLGTGLIESILAGACARIGKSVLVLDSNQYYGNDWASFSLDALLTYARREPTESSIGPPVVEETANERVLNLPWGDTLTPDGLAYTEYSLSDQSVDREDSSICNTENDLRRLSKRFNLDLCSKIVFGESKLVKLLISSGVSRYCEFCSVERILTIQDGEIQKVPFSRSDIFQSQNVSLIQKRYLMKFIEFVVDINDFEDIPDLPFAEYLRDKHKLPEALVAIIITSIAVAPFDIKAVQGLALVKQFCTSLGIFANSPYLWPIYGVGELPQSFSRFAAVFGAIFCLHVQPLSKFIFSDRDKNRALAVVTDKGDRIEFEHIILNRCFLPDTLVPEFISNEEHYLRGILVTSSSILPSEKDKPSFTTIPPLPSKKFPVRFLELGHTSGAASPNYFVVHVTGIDEDGSSSEDQLLPYVSTLFKTACEPSLECNQPLILVSFYFKQKHSILKSSSFDNFHVTPEPDSDLGFDRAVNFAQSLFSKIYPEEEFMPKAPDPDDIIFDDSTEDTGAANDELCNNVNSND